MMGKIKLYLVAIALSLMLICNATAEDEPKNAMPQQTPLQVTKVNLQIDAEFTQKGNEGREREETEFLKKTIKELKKRGIKGTLFVTADFSTVNPHLVNDLFRERFEIALKGYSTGERLAALTKEAQKELLSNAKEVVEGCVECGTLQSIIGFRPQNFSQNSVTYEIHAELGIRYNSGFKAHLLFLPGHENTTKPYRNQNDTFWAVPISTFYYKGELVCLCDLSAQGKFIVEEWKEVLSSKLTEVIERGEPLVIVIHGWLTGDEKKYGFWGPFLDFLDYAQNRKVHFVTSRELIKAYGFHKFEDPDTGLGGSKIPQYK